jgi:hypothetical protein
MAGGDLNSAVEIEMKQGKIEQRRRANADVVNLQARRHKPGDHRFGISIRGGTTVASHSDTSPAVVGDGRAVHFAEQQGKIFVEVDFG